MMAACVLAIGALLVAADEPDPAQLVRRLGSDRFAERVEAARALERLGKAALPALRAAKDSQDPKVRARAAALLETLARGADVDRLTRPALIKLDFRDRPLSEVIGALNDRHDLGLTFHFGPLPPRGMRMAFVSPDQKAKETESLSRRTTLEADRPVPFWEAVDRLCAAGQLQHDLYPQDRFGLTKGQFLLFAGVGGTSIASDSGPLRVKVVGLHSTFEQNFAEAAIPGGGRPGPPARHRGGGNLLVRMAVIPEPGLVVRQVGPPTFIEVVDDRDRSFLPPGADVASDYASRTGHQVPSLNGNSGFELLASLRLPDPAGRSIRRLRGSIPIVTVAYATNPIAIPLEGAAGKSARNDEATVSIIEVARDENAGVTVEVEVIPNGPAPPQSDLWTRPGPPDFVTLRMGPSELLNRLELLDASGRELALSWNQTRAREWFASQRRVRLFPTALYENAPPAPGGRFQGRIAKKPVPVELRYYGFVQTVTTIPFDFHDVPLP